MYLYTLSTCDWLYENTPYPSCHSNLSAVSALSLMYFDDFAFIDFINSDTATTGFKPTKQCTWSSTPFTIMVLQPASFIKPPITPKSLLFQFLLITAFLYFTANTICK